ncbi:MAG: PcfK-like family protein [Mangrovibacterium sp.]
MKASTHFTNTIKAYLDKRAETDSLFAIQYRKPNKNIEDCITYILNQVQKSGCNGFEDIEIYNLALDFYDEDELEIDDKIEAKVVVNHFVEITEEEKAQAKKEALERVQNEAYQQMKATPKGAKKTAVVHQQTLFDF